MKKLAVIIFALSLTSCWYSFEKKVSLDKTFQSYSLDSLNYSNDSTNHQDSVVIKTEYTINGFHKTEYQTYKTNHNGDSVKSNRRVVVVKGPNPIQKIILNPEILINSAFFDDDVTARKQVLAQLTDEGSIQHVAFFDEDAEVRKLAVTMLKEESNIQHVAFFDEDINVRTLAVTFLKEQSNIQHVAFFDEEVSVRKVALGKLTGRADVQHVATFDDDTEMRKTALNMLIRRSLKKG
jgi:hypothetical protein